MHPHYIFTQHDMARVFQGMMLLSSKTKSRPRAKSIKKSPITENTKEEIGEDSGPTQNQRDDVARQSMQDDKIHEDKRYDQAFSIDQNNIMICRLRFFLIVI